MEKNNKMEKKMKLLNEIKSMKEIIIVQADKDGKVVRLDKLEYIIKIDGKLWWWKCLWEN